MKVPDIYFEEFWGQLNAEHDGGIYQSYIFEDDNGVVLYRFIKRPTGILPETFDIVTPWGFNGPIVISCKEDKRRSLVSEFDKNFQDYCKANNIVAEYARFSPWLKNHEDFKDIYQLQYNTYTVGIDLTGDFFHEEFSPPRRTNVRKAEKEGVRVCFDFSCETVDEFYRLYNIMAEKNQINDTYRFTKAFIENLIEKCKDQVLLVNCLYRDNIITSGLFLQTDEYLHSQLVGNDPAFFKYNGNAIMLYKASEWAKLNGKRTHHIGGAYKESVLQYKMGFTKRGVYDFYVGKKIRLKGLYDQLIELKGEENTQYFPAYRSYVETDKSRIERLQNGSNKLP